MEDFGLNPNIERTRNIDGSVYERITYPDGRTETRVFEAPPFYSAYSSGEAIRRTIDGRLVPPSFIEDRYATTNTITNSWGNYEDLRKYFESEEESKVNVVRKKSYNKDEHIVACCDEKDLAIENILKTLSAIKGKLMIDIAPIHIKTIECSITPQVRQNIAAASKKLKMYGKKRPIIARFDEYGNRLPDEIDIGTAQGITLKIIDPDKYGKYYIELKGIEFPHREYNPMSFEVDSDDLPF